MGVQNGAKNKTQTLNNTHINGGTSKGKPWGNKSKMKVVKTINKTPTLEDPKQSKINFKKITHTKEGLTTNQLEITKQGCTRVEFKTGWREPRIS